MSLTRRRVLNAVLIVSLALNLLIFGGMVTRMLSSPNGRPIPPNLNWVVRDLSDETRERLQPTLSEFSDEIRPLRYALFQAQRSVNELLVQNPLEESAITTAFEDLRAKGEEYQALSHRQTLALFDQLSPEERVAVMRFIQERSRPPRDRDRDSRSDSQSGSSN